MREGRLPTGRSERVLHPEIGGDRTPRAALRPGPGPGLRAGSGPHGKPATHRLPDSSHCGPVHRSATPSTSLTRRKSPRPSSTRPSRSGKAAPATASTFRAFAAATRESAMELASGRDRVRRAQQWHSRVRLLPGTEDRPLLEAMSDTGTHGCSVRAANLAHELGHVLGLADHGRHGRMMGPVPRTGGAARRVFPDECSAAGALWSTSAEVGAGIDGYPCGS